eukprot:362349-Chlamydomonas_euryale.AAC.5
MHARTNAYMHTKPSRAAAFVTAAAFGSMHVQEALQASKPLWMRIQPKPQPRRRLHGPQAVAQTAPKPPRTPLHPRRLAASAASRPWNTARFGMTRKPAAPGGLATTPTSLVRVAGFAGMLLLMA